MRGTKVLTVLSVSNLQLCRLNFLKKNILYINRTTDPTFDSSGSWYQGSLVQRYNLDTGESILSDKLTTPNWVPWMIPKIQNGQIGVGPFDRAGFFQ